MKRRYAVLVEPSVVRKVIQLIEEKAEAKRLVFDGSHEGSECFVLPPSAFAEIEEIAPSVPARFVSNGEEYDYYAVYENTSNDGWYVCTLGRGGKIRAIWNRLAPKYTFELQEIGRKT